jgi:hypothetical protein
VASILVDEANIRWIHPTPRRFNIASEESDAFRSITQLPLKSAAAKALEQKANTRSMEIANERI